MVDILFGSCFQFFESLLLILASLKLSIIGRYSNKKSAKARIRRGRDPIFSPQRILRGRDAIFSTRLHKELSIDLDLQAISNLKIDHWSHLRKGNEGYGGDLDENWLISL